MQDPEFKRRLASLYQEVQQFAVQYQHSYLSSIAENPHITRLIEAFTFLHNKLHYAFEESKTEIASTLVDLMYPYLNQPLPSYMMLQFLPYKDQAHCARLSKGTIITVEHRKQKAKFQITWDQEIVPIYIESISYGALQTKELKGAKTLMSVRLATKGGQKFSCLNLKKLRFYINRQDKAEYFVYEAIFEHLVRVVIRDNANAGRSFTLEKGSIKSAGFDSQEYMLPRQENVFPGYQLITEFFFFPAKFLFFDIYLDDLSNFSESITIDFYFDNESLRELVFSSTLMLNVVPVINLFSAESDPISILDGKKDYQILVDKINPSDLSVYFVNSVHVGLVSGALIEARPLTEAILAKDQVLWSVEYKKSLAGNFRECFMALVCNTTSHLYRYFYAKLYCFNNDLPYTIFATAQEKVKISLEVKSLFQEENIVPVSGPSLVKKICSEVDQKLQLLTCLSVHYLNILDQSNAKHVLKSLLALHAQNGIFEGKDLVDSISAVKVFEHIDKLNSKIGSFFCRGSLFQVYFENTEKVPKGLLLLFCRALDEFLAFYCPVNSFIKFEGWHKGQPIYLGAPRHSKTC